MPCAICGGRVIGGGTKCRRCRLEERQAEEWDLGDPLEDSDDE